MAPDSRRSASTTPMTLPPVSSALACTCTIGHGRVDDAVPGRDTGADVDDLPDSRPAG
jgi:hypothetical protein